MDAETEPHCIIHCTSDDGKLVTPESLQSWESLKKAGEVRKHEAILAIVKNTTDGSVPQNVYYHRQCRIRFTMKRDLDNIIKTENKKIKSDDNVPSVSNTPRRSIRPKSSCSSSKTVLEPECIFCQKKTKYLKGSHSRENLTQAQQLRVDESLRKVAVLKNDSRILAILAQEIVAAEGHYHRSCYRFYVKNISKRSGTRDEDEVSCDRDDSGDDSDSSEDSRTYSSVERLAYTKLFSFMREENGKKFFELKHLAGLLEGWMKESGIKEIKQSTKKHMKRKITSEFKEAVHMLQTQNKRVLLYFDGLTRDELVLENYQLKKDLEVYQNCSSNVKDSIKKSALSVRHAVKEVIVKQSWPPTVSELEVVNIPAFLDLLLRCLMLDDKTEGTERMELLIKSVAQDIMYGISKGRYKPPKHILLPYAVKSISGNVELIRILNRLGHGVSYTQLEEVDTSLCLQKLAMAPQDAVAIPTNIVPGIDTVLAFDNIDRNEATLSGGGTSHRVNGIVVQPVTEGPLQFLKNDVAVLKKEKIRTIKTHQKPIQAYNAGEKFGPPRKFVNEIQTTELIDETKQKDLLFILARLCSCTNQQVSSWTGYNIRVHDNDDIVNSNIGYLPTINAPATDMSTINEVLNQTLKIMTSLQLDSITCVFDQAIYCKASEIKWKNNEKFSPIVLRLGTFHTTLAMLSVLGKRFQDAGLKDLCIEANVIAEGSVSSVLEGRSYNRALRLHKLTYEALMRIAWFGFQTWVESDNAEIKDTVSSVIESITEFSSDITAENHKEIMQLPAYSTVYTAFQKYLEYLRNNNGPLSSFWVSYLDMVQIMLCMVRATREGDWKLHLASVREMLPWCFAYDALNYAKYMSVYYRDMTNLPDEHPDVHRFMESGGFSVQMSSNNPFGRIPVDQALEETVNKDTQTAGGTKGFSLKPGAVQRYYLTSEYRTTFLRYLRQMAGFGKGACEHVDLYSSRIMRDERDVVAMVDILKNSWINPFSGEEQLLIISTGAVAPQNIQHDLLEAHVSGENAYHKFKKERLEPGDLNVKFHDRLKKQNLKTFKDLIMTKKIKTSTGNDTLIRADRNLFAHILLLARSRTLNMEQVLRHPLGPLPWSLASGDGLLRKTNKAQLGRELEKNVQLAEHIPHRSACLIDGMALVHRLKVDNMTFGDIADVALNRVIHEAANSARIDVIFDEYREMSIKSAERVARGQQAALQFVSLHVGHRVKQFSRFLKNGKNKNQLINFFVHYWSQELVRQRLDKKELYVSYSNTCLKLTQQLVQEVEELKSFQEEADTKLMLHASHVPSTFNSIILCCEDTDVLLLALAFCSKIKVPMYQKCAAQSRVRFLDINKIADFWGQDTCDCLLGLHAFTGCDTVSAFAGKGKIKALKMVRGNNEYQKIFKELGNDWVVSDELAHHIQNFVCKLYGDKQERSTVNQYRYKMFCSKKGEVEPHQLPPCEDCLLKHTMRANYQSAVWKNSLKTTDMPSPIGNGWIVKQTTEGEEIGIDWMEGLPAPQAIIEMISCECKKCCIPDRCPCIVNSLKCTKLCKLPTCDNQQKDDEEEEQTVTSISDEEEGDEML